MIHRVALVRGGINVEKLADHCGRRSGRQDRRRARILVRSVGSDVALIGGFAATADAADVGLIGVL